MLRIGLSCNQPHKFHYSYPITHDSVFFQFNFLLLKYVSFFYVQQHTLKVGNGNFVYSREEAYSTDSKLWLMVTDFTLTATV
jgi:hypothetical protein